MRLSGHIIVTINAQREVHRIFSTLRRPMRLVKISLVILAVCLAIIGQTNRGGISGTVTDSNGAIVPGAKVTITNEATGRAVTLTTSSEGTYIANTLDPALYTVLVEVPNFK